MQVTFDIGLKITSTQTVSRETPDSDNDATCAELRNDEKFMSSVDNSRPVSIVSDAAGVMASNEKRWVDIVSGKT